LKCCRSTVSTAFDPALRPRIGVHTCPGGDCDFTHSADVDYAELLPDLFNLQAGNFHVQLAGEKNPERALAVIKQQLRPGQRVFVGVIDVLNPDVEEPETVRDRVLQAAEFTTKTRKIKFRVLRAFVVIFLIEFTCNLRFVA
jgi:5-methyltetrahydropteroyltriglutamate--homocysteine methyltransferase